MAISPRLIKRRIRSITNTRKITRAMELVAAAKMRRASQLTLSSRAYSKSAQEIVAEIRTLVDPKSHPLLAGRPEAKSVMLIVAGSNRGLCGGFNYQILKKASEFLKLRAGQDLRVVTVGKRVELGMKRLGQPIVASFDAISDAPSYERSRPIGDYAYREFMDGHVDRVFLAYTDFKSAVTQVPTLLQLLPIIPEQDLQGPVEETAELDEDAGYYEKREELEGRDEPNVLFEPNPKAILDALLPRLIETEVYQSLLESSSSEQAARMLAMRNATENANEMVQDLTFSFNQARQASITREISEISAGKAALE